MIQLSLLTFALISILVWFDISGHATVSPQSRNRIIFLSCSIAVACLVLWIGFLLFRNRRHLYFFERPDSEHKDTTSLDEDTTDLEAHYLSHFEYLIHGLTRYALLGLFADTLVHSLLRQPAIARRVCAFFAVPLVTRIWTWYRAVRQVSIYRHGWLDLEVIDPTVGATLNTLLFVASWLVLFEWVIQVPMTLRFSLTETLILDLTVWILSYLVNRGLTDYLTGAILIVFYVLATLGLCLSLRVD